MLNAEQQAAVESRDGVFVVVAGPGSGKTKVTVERFLRLLLSGVPTKDILSLTFTAAAAEEMTSRAGIVGSKDVFRTFHSFAIDFLKQERQYLPFVVCDTIIPVEMQDFELLFRLCKTYPGIPNWHILKGKISEWKREAIDVDRAIRESVEPDEFFCAQAYRDYERICRAEGWLDFDSVMQETVKLLESNEDVRNRHKRKYIQVDECQDTDIVQFRLLQLIFNGNIFAVGDENQLIYEWRSAMPGSLMNFSQKFPGAKILYLGTNYRSTQKLVSFFKKILPVDNGLASHMVSAREEGEDPKLIQYDDDYAEADAVLRHITEPLETAVIARTNRKLFRFQKLCAARNIKYKILGKKDFWEQNEVKKLLKLAKDHQMEFQGVNAGSALKTLTDRHRLIETYKHAGDKDSDPIENITDIGKMAGRHANIPTFLDHIRKMTHARRSQKGLTLATVHQSKGKEFKHVYVVGAEQGCMPHSEADNLAEEKRIFFVACSRAGDKLTVSFSGSRSMFLDQFKDLIEDHTSFGDLVGFKQWGNMPPTPFGE